MSVTDVRGNYVAGEWREGAAGGGEYTIVNPARPTEEVGRFPSSTAVDVEAAVDAANGAGGEWAATPAAARGELLRATAAAIDARAERMAHDMTLEMGKPIREARGEVARAASIFRFFAAEAQRPVGEVFEQTGAGRILTLRRPLGVVGLITPWNFPAAIPAWKSAPALLCGNTVVLKAARDAPLTAMHLAACLEEAGLPAGVFNLILGDGATAGATLVEQPQVAAISFTGSVAVGHAVRDRATCLHKRVQCELGGQNPLIVTADADLDRAAEAAFAGAYWSAGQKCTATRRIYVEDSAYDGFRQRLLARIERAVVGDPADPDTEVGPLVNETQFQGVLEAIAEGVSEGGKLIAGGKSLDEGYIISPTLFEDVSDSAHLSCEEVFGPVASLYRYDSVDEAISRANAVAMGLSASIFTSSIAAAEQFTRHLQAGILHVNSQTAGAEVHVPFGGIKESGWGPHEQGRSAREFFTDVISVYYDA